MKSKDCQYTKKRRGLSTIVGALLFVVLMVATFSVLAIALTTQTDIVETSRDVTDLGLKQQQEKFVFNAAQQLPAGFLQVNLTNQGQNVAEMFTMVMTNVTDPGQPTQTIPIPSATSFLVPGDEDETNIVSTLDLKMDTPAPTFTEDYDFKVISSLGTIKKLSITCDETGLCGTTTPLEGDAALTSQLFLDGPAGVNSKPSTVVMFVQNTGAVPLEDVYPVAFCTSANFPSIAHEPPPPDPPGRGDFTSCELDPPPDPGCGAGTGVCLAPGQTVLFLWDGIVEGDVGDVFTFCNNVQGKEVDTTPVGPTPPECDQITVINPNDCGGADCAGGETIILIDDLLIKPSIFMVIPSPFGATTKTADFTGLWGINLANPTDEPMDISKVTIVAYPPGGASQDNVFSGKDDDCLQDDILPDLGPQPFGFWNCPRDNIVMWQNFANPLILQANSTESFLVRLEPSGIKPGGEPANLDALIVQANVYSTFGSFGKSGYQSSMYIESSPIVNVYLTDTIDSRDSFIGNINDIPENSIQTFKVVLADLDDEGTTFINIGAKLIINVPREWTFVDFLTTTGFVDPPSWVVHSDGSTQIIGITTEEIGKAGEPQARTIEFRAQAPDVKAPRLYVMYILADGTITDPTPEDKTIGPLMEAVLNVDPLP